VGDPNILWVPEGLNVYSHAPWHLYGSSGAECEHIALRWSAVEEGAASYKHLVPPGPKQYCEQHTITPRAMPVGYLYLCVGRLDAYIVSSTGSSSEIGRVLEAPTVVRFRMNISARAACIGSEKRKP
jgi:hypothetical protein